MLSLILLTYFDVGEVSILAWLPNTKLLRMSRQKACTSHPAFRGTNNAKKNFSPDLWYTIIIDYIIYAWMRYLLLKASFSEVTEVSHLHRIDITSRKGRTNWAQWKRKHLDGMIGITNFLHNILYIVGIVEKPLAISDDYYLSFTLSHHLCFWVPDSQHPGRSHIPTTQSQL